MLQVGTMNLTESRNICCNSDGVICTVKVNIKETFMGKDGLVQMFSPKLLSKYLEANFKHLLEMELTTDVIFLVLSSVNNDLSIYVFLQVWAVKSDT